jgi:outer membrane protein OmpA-like peptidoglycan-associated protein
LENLTIFEGKTSMRALRTHVASAFICVALVGLAACQAANHGLNAKQVAMLKQEGFVQKDDGWELALSSKVLFDVESDALKPDTRASIEHTGQALLSVQITRLRVEGYTDSTGTIAHNNELSQRRAASVAAALGTSGLSGGHIDAHGLGQSHPVADNTTEAGRAENRRVAIIVPELQD